MSDDNLEGLDNASLRKKCLEFGLPNVPVTDSSRQVLIRRLRATMTGEPADKGKNRRKTIHVSKIPSPVETTAGAPAEEAPKPPPARTNRRTIAASNVTSTVDDVPIQQIKPDSISERRRSVRSQITEEASTNIPISQKRKTAVVEEEDEDDDEDDVILLEAAEKSEREVVIPRTRRSVSLTKTGVVTTSYSQEKVVTPSTVNETESESENDFVTNYANSYEPLPRPVTQPRTLYGLTQPTLSQQSRETDFGFVQPPQPLKPRESMYEFTQPQLPQEKTFGLSQRKSSEPDPTLSFRTTTVNRTSIEPEPSYRPSLYTSSRYSSLGSGNSSETSTTTSTIRRFTTSGLGAQPASVATKYASSYNDEEEDEENEAPYLSDFARKLERLKAEPLVKGLESPRGAPPKRDTQRYTSSIVGRRSTSQKDTVSDSFKNLLIALDRKYNLKRNIAIAFIIILLLFIYIVFVR